MEYNHLQELPVVALRNRLLLLHHLSELFCPCIPMFDLEGALGETGLGPAVGFDTLRGILISQGKVPPRPAGDRRRAQPRSRLCTVPRAQGPGPTDGAWLPVPGSHPRRVFLRRWLSGKWCRQRWCATASTGPWWS